MSLNDVIKVLEFCKEAEINHVILIGGEPTIYPNISFVVKKCNDFGISSILVTNGIFFAKKENCKMIYDNGLSNCDISLKGNDKFDFLRVTGSDKFDDVKKAMDNLTELDYDFTASMVITEENLFTFKEGLKVIFQTNCKHVNLSFAYDFCNKNEKDPYYLEKTRPLEFIKNFVSQIDEINSITNGRRSIESGFPLCLFSDEQIKKLGKNIVTGCQLLGGNGIIFDNELNIIPCNTMFPIKLGKMGVDFNNFEEFKKYFSTEEYLTLRKYLRSLPSKECLRCSKRGVCGGGCVNFWTHTNFNNLKHYLHENEIKLPFEK